MMISLVGGGGKTTTMFYIGNFFANMGKRVVITTSTHIEKTEKFAEIKSAKELENLFSGSEPVVVGTDEGKKLSSLELSELENFTKYADIVLVEADGAKKLPIKIPREDNEPVIPVSTDVCIVCMGIDAVGESLSEKCFRYERALEFFGWDKDHILTPKDAAFILTSKKAGLKGVGDRKTVFLINKADTENDMKKALEVKKYIEFYCKENNFENFKVSITSYKNHMEFSDFDFLKEGI